MKLLQLVTAWLLAALIRADWSVKDGTYTVVEGPIKTSQKFESPEGIWLKTGKSLELTFQTENDGKGSRPHQAFAYLYDPESGLDYTFPPSQVKPNGEAKVTISWSSIPEALKIRGEDSPLILEIIVGSFSGSPKRQLVSNSVNFEKTTTKPKGIKSAGAKPEIIHQFRPAPTTVSSVIASVFVIGAIVITLDLFVVWAYYIPELDLFGGLKSALSRAPFGHTILLTSLGLFEATFISYFLGQSVFTTIYTVAAIAPIAIIAGSRALGEVASRKL